MLREISLMKNDLYKKLKVLNSEEIILGAKNFGLTYNEIATLCKVSKTMVSHWGNENRKNKPVYEQIEPLLMHVGTRRLKVRLEEPSPAIAKCHDEHADIKGTLIYGLIFLMMMAVTWWTQWKPCAENWEQCKKLDWYRMPSYGLIKIGMDMEELRRYRLLKIKLNPENSNKANK